jgi:hypothetical protein
MIKTLEDKDNIRWSSWDWETRTKLNELISAFNDKFPDEPHFTCGNGCYHGEAAKCDCKCHAKKLTPTCLLEKIKKILN